MSDVQGLTQDKGSVFKVLSWGLIFVLAIFLPIKMPPEYHAYKLSESKCWFMAYSVPPSLVVLTGILIGLKNGQVENSSFMVKLLVCICGVLCLIFGILAIMIFATHREVAGDMSIYIGGILSISAGICMIIDTIVSFTS